MDDRIKDRAVEDMKKIYLILDSLPKDKRLNDVGQLQDVLAEITKVMLDYIQNYYQGEDSLKEVLKEVLTAK